MFFVETINLSVELDQPNRPAAWNDDQKDVKSGSHCKLLANAVDLSVDFSLRRRMIFDSQMKKQEKLIIFCRSERRGRWQRDRDRAECPPSISLSDHLLIALLPLLLFNEREDGEGVGGGGGAGR